MSVCQSGVGDVDPMQVMCAPAAPRPVPLMAGKMAAAVAVCRNSPIPPLGVARGGRKIRPVVFVPLAPAPTVGDIATRTRAAGSRPRHSESTCSRRGRKASRTRVIALTVSAGAVDSSNTPSTDRGDGAQDVLEYSPLWSRHWP